MTQQSALTQAEMDILLVLEAGPVPITTLKQNVGLQTTSKEAQVLAVSNPILVHTVQGLQRARLVRNTRAGLVLTPRGQKLILSARGLK